MKKIILTIENMDSTLASVKQVLGVDKKAEELTRKDLVALTRAGEEWTLPPSDIPQGDKVASQNADTKPGVHRDTIEGEPLDLEKDTDFTDPSGEAVYNTQTRIDDFSRTDVISRVADELAAKLSNSDYHSMSKDELKAVLAHELKTYLTK